MKELFDYPAIEMNKQGKKSESQIKEIKESTSYTIWLGGGAVLLVIGGCFYAMLTTISNGPMGGIFANILGIVALIALARGLVIWNLNRKLLSEPIQTLEGKVTYKMQNDIVQYMDSDRFIAETHDGKTLQPGGLAGFIPQLPPGNYRFYFLKSHNWLLSAEPLSSEEEMRQSLNEILAKAFKYDMAHLEQCRQDAREGKMKTTEGLPVIETVENMASVAAFGFTKGSRIAPLFYCTIGEVQFLIPRRGSYAMLKALPYRAYYRETESNSLFGELVNLMKDKKVEAVEVA